MSEKPFGQWKVGDEFLPYHPSASHTRPEFRDGWNHCYEAAQARIAELQAQVEQLRTEAKVASDRIQELGRFAKAQRGEIEGLRADAQRYRWIRDHCESDGHAYWLPELCVMEGHQVPTTQDIDAAIDSARAGREDGNG